MANNLEQCPTCGGEDFVVASDGAFHCRNSSCCAVYVNDCLISIGRMLPGQRIEEILATGKLSTEANRLENPELLDEYEALISGPKTPPQMLRDAAKIYEQRHEMYEKDYFHEKRFNFVMRELFPGKIEFIDKKQFIRLGHFMNMVHGLVHYAANFDRGGHVDSLDDLAVYAMMLREMDCVSEMSVKGDAGNG